MRITRGMLQVILSKINGKLVEDYDLDYKLTIDVTTQLGDGRSHYEITCISYVTPEGRDRRPYISEGYLTIRECWCTLNGIYETLCL